MQFQFHLSVVVVWSESVQSCEPVYVCYCASLIPIPIYRSINMKFTIINRQSCPALLLCPQVPPGASGVSRCLWCPQVPLVFPSASGALRCLWCPQVPMVPPGAYGAPRCLWCPQVPLVSPGTSGVPSAFGVPSAPGGSMSLWCPQCLWCLWYLQCSMLIKQRIKPFT